jgi:hypothetical protein
MLRRFLQVSAESLVTLSLFRQIIGLVEEQRRRGREGFGFVGIWKYQLDSATKLTLVVIARSRFFTRRSGVA